MKKLEIIIQPEKLEALKTILDASNVSGIMISNIMGYVEEIKTGAYGDGKIFVYEVQDAVRIRTGERGSAAL